MCDVSLHGNISIRVGIVTGKPTASVHSIQATSALRSVVLNREPEPGTREQLYWSSHAVKGISRKGGWAARLQLSKLVSLHVMLPTSSSIDLGVTVQQAGCRLQDTDAILPGFQNDKLYHPSSETNAATLTPSIGTGLVKDWYDT